MYETQGARPPTFAPSQVDTCAIEQLGFQARVEVDLLWTPPSLKGLTLDPFDALL